MGAPGSEHDPSGGARRRHLPRPVAYHRKQLRRARESIGASGGGEELKALHSLPFDAGAPHLQEGSNITTRQSRVPTFSITCPGIAACTVPDPDLVYRTREEPSGAWARRLQSSTK